MRQITIDCWGVTSTEAFWQRNVDQARPAHPEFFGRNLDAFWDALGGGPGCPDAERIVFARSSELALLRTASGGSFLAALQEIAADSTEIEIRLT